MKSVLLYISLVSLLESHNCLKNINTTLQFDIINYLKSFEVYYSNFIFYFKLFITLRYIVL